ncbi:tachykinin-4 isoform X3 [Enhydra lutris kenyoni]|uniref:Tachykinin-4 isoform X3 n=1 Tax=Enhydra lutris kenyoni TaxID=391180 RepID=A0A2Y9JXF2_ENHLU|nr:tachykinin-4 isoform X3 [Enhydra lutris kenyoni]
MLPCLPLLLLMGLSAGTVTADEELALGAEAGSWITLTLEDDGIHLQLQQVKRGKASQFFGLMGKRVRGIPPIQPDRRTALVLALPCPSWVPAQPYSAALFLLYLV